MNLDKYQKKAILALDKYQKKAILAAAVGVWLVQSACDMWLWNTHLVEAFGLRSITFGQTLALDLVLSAWCGRSILKAATAEEQVYALTHSCAKYVILMTFAYALSASGVWS